MPTRLTAASAPRSAAASEFGIADIGLNGVDLADATERLQMEREVGAARRDADAPAVARQRANQMADR